RVWLIVSGLSPSTCPFPTVTHSPSLTRTRTSRSTRTRTGRSTWMAIGTSERGMPRVVVGEVDVVGEVVDLDEVPAPLDDVPVQRRALHRAQQPPPGLGHVADAGQMPVQFEVLLRPPGGGEDLPV